MQMTLSTSLTCGLLLLLIGDSIFPGAAAATATTYYVDCINGSDTNGGTSIVAPFHTLTHARDVIRKTRSVTDNRNAVTVLILAGVCELRYPLHFTEEDSHVEWSAYQGANVLISGGLQIPPAQIMGRANSSIKTIDLRSSLHLMPNDTGVLRGRGYAGGSACILLDNFEESAMELFYRAPVDTPHASVPIPRMMLARYPNLASRASVHDWIQVASVQKDNSMPTVHTLGVSQAVAARARAKDWQAQQTARGDIWTHGLWSWDWADSHRHVTAVGDSADNLLNVSNDDINRDSTLKKGGNFYVYNVESELDSPGEYYINRKAMQASFIPPRPSDAHKYPPGTTCEWQGHS